MKLLRGVLRGADAVSGFFGAVAMALLVVLVSAMTVEVVSRRLLGSPTQWAYDVSYMTNGAIFVLGLACVMRARQHIAIDFLAARMPPRLRDGVEAVFFGLVLLPVLLFLAQVAWADAWDAWRTGRLERVSPWAPVMWPYLSAMAVGVTALALQTLAEALRSAAGMLGSRALGPVRRSAIS